MVNDNTTKAFFQPLLEGLNELTQVANLFKSLEKTYAKFLKSLTKTHANLVLSTSDPATSLSNSLVVFKGSLGIQTKQLVYFLDRLKIDVIEPLLLFSDHMRNNFSELTNQTELVSEPLQASQKMLIKFRDIYHKDAELLENLQRSHFVEANRDGIISLHDSYQQKVTDDIQNYLLAEENFNHNYEEYEKTIPRIINSLKFNEESRVYFLKTIFEKFLHHANVMNTVLNESTDDLSKIIGNINSKFDIQGTFKDIKLKMPEKITFEAYETWKQKRSIDEVSDIEILNSTLDLLVFRKKGKHADFGRLGKIIEDLQGKEWFVQALEARKSYCKLLESDLEKLSEIVKGVIENIGYTEQYNFLFSRLIDLADVFYAEILGKKVYLAKFLSSVGSFNDDSRWLFAINLAITEQTAREKSATKQRLLKSKSKNIFSSIKDLASKIGSSKKKKQKLVEKKVAINVLHDFVIKLRKLSVKTPTARSIILTFAIKHELDPESLHSLLAIVQSPPIYSKKLTKSKAFSITVCLPFELSLPYLTLQDSLPLLYLKKSCYDILYIPIISKFLLESSEKLQILRPVLWYKLLRPYFPLQNYSELLENVDLNENKLSGINYIIDMDVYRSYQDKQESHEILKQILKTYGNFDSEVGYCQGMNFILGTIYFVLMDENDSFNCLAGIIRKNQMKLVLGQKLDQLKCMFFKLDKLIELFLPDVYMIFISRGIFAASFASSWFVTLFSSCFTGDIRPVYKIWDYFLVKGWKIIFKTGIYILQSNEKKLTNGTYEDNLHLLSGNKLFVNCGFGGEFMKSVNKIKISNRMLSQLEKDYEEILNESNFILLD